LEAAAADEIITAEIQAEMEGVVGREAEAAAETRVALRGASEASATKQPQEVGPKQFRLLTGGHEHEFKHAWMGQDAIVSHQDIYTDGGHLYREGVESGEVIHAGSRGILNERC
jgi:hypothetical protein